MKTMKTPRGTARKARRARMDFDTQPVARSKIGKAALHRLAASLAR